MSTKSGLSYIPDGCRVMKFTNIWTQCCYFVQCESLQDHTLLQLLHNDYCKKTK